jgi:hypothetical protein
LAGDSCPPADLVVGEREKGELSLGQFHDDARLELDVIVHAATMGLGITDHPHGDLLGRDEIVPLEGAVALDLESEFVY